MQITSYLVLRANTSRSKDQTKPKQTKKLTNFKTAKQIEQGREEGTTTTVLKVGVVVLKVVLRKCYEIVKENACGSLRQQQQTPLSVCA